MKKYNHAYTLGFSVNTDQPCGEPIINLEVMEALLLRIIDLTKNNEWDEALGLPYDTYENESESGSASVGSVGVVPPSR